MPELYPYQQEGVAQAWAWYCAGLHGVIIGDDMGLGKTVQGIELINMIRPYHVLIVCPSAVKLNWMAECEEWLKHEYTFHLIQGRDCVVRTPGYYSIQIVNYELLNHLDFSSCEYDLVIYDEGHKLRNDEAKQTLAASQICTSKRLILTGTPIINRPKDVWQLLVLCGIVHPDDFHAFGLKYCKAYQRPEFKSQGRGKKRKTVRKLVWDYDGASNLEELGQWLRHLCMIRRMKTDVLKDLPAKTRQVITLENPGESDLLVLDKLNGLQADLRNLENIGVQWMQPAENYNAQVKKLTDDITLAFEEVSLARHETALSKVPQAIAFIKDALDSSSAKIVVAAHHRDVIELIRKEFYAESVEFVGGMSDSSKQAVVNDFRQEPSCRLFFGQITAAGTGTDGLQRVCSHMICVESPWSSAERDQLEDRLCRIGQTLPVLIQYLTFDNTIDARVLKTVARKEKILEKALN